LPAPNSTSATETAAEAPEVARPSSEAERGARVEPTEARPARPEVQVELGAEVYQEALRGTCLVDLFRRRASDLRARVADPAELLGRRDQAVNIPAGMPLSQRTGPQLADNQVMHTTRCAQAFREPDTRQVTA
jgi:hypothetical protein